MALPKKIKAVSIGYLGSQYCYIGISKDEAMDRYKQRHGYNDDLEGLTITEGNIIDGCFWNYDIGLEDEKTTEL